MKKTLLLLLLMLVPLTAACTPEEVQVWNALSIHDLPEPPEIAMVGAEARNLALTLPATAVTFDLHGQSVNVVAYLKGTNQTGFVFEYPDGTRGYVTSADRPLLSYVFPVSEDPCAVDPFGVHTVPIC